MFLFYFRGDELVYLFIFRIIREYRFEVMIIGSGIRLTEGGGFIIMGDGYKGINSKFRSINGGF